VNGKKAPKKRSPLMFTHLLQQEAKIPPERGGPFRNVRRVLDGTSAEDPKLRKILTDELTAFTAALVEGRKKGGSATRLAAEKHYPSYRACWNKGNPRTDKPWKSREECADHLGISIPTLRKALARKEKEKG
jgi:hypothetical protein